MSATSTESTSSGGDGGGGGGGGGFRPKKASTPLQEHQAEEDGRDRRGTTIWHRSFFPLSHTEMRKHSHNHTHRQKGESSTVLWSGCGVWRGAGSHSYCTVKEQRAKDQSTAQGSRPVVLPCPTPRARARERVCGGVS